MAVIIVHFYGNVHHFVNKVVIVVIESCNFSADYQQSPTDRPRSYGMLFVPMQHKE